MSTGQLAVHIRDEDVGHCKFPGKNLNGLFKKSGKKMRRDSSEFLSLATSLSHLDVLYIWKLCQE